VGSEMCIRDSGNSYNAGNNLDSPVFGVTFPGGKVDSGAIMVGAGAACGYQPHHSRLAYSNYGRRVNVQGYGECVTSTGWDGNLYNIKGINSYYTNDFGGTSSASALVAGVAASVSSAYKQLNNVSPSPALVRSILMQTGVAQNNSVNAGAIGPLANLQAALSRTDLVGPTTPQNNNPWVNPQNKVWIRWSAATDNVGVVGYRVYRNNVYIATATSAAYTDLNARPNTVYTYKIQAVDGAGRASAFSLSKTVRTRIR
jgi:serine protease